MVKAKKKLHIQIYKRGKSFIHLLGIDKKETKGGYKTFFRSLDTESEEYSASLMIKLNNRYDLEKIINELKIMEKLREYENNLSFESLDIIEKEKPKTRENYLIFQCQLYDSDLKKYKEKKI